MFEIAWLSAKLFFKGKLLRDRGYFFKQIVIGTSIASMIILSLSQTKLPLWLPITVSSLVTGTVMPFLFKDFKMK
ncbi:hypothetical protein PN465_14575 [Nodularia spumigena CS-584]|jgi:hypothetical protein|uniref:Uncharacterized protein n=2 Tax=Nodularia spumigena TaxID=70799 RepID=A0A2S0QAD3_NODSP|nr:hypothetical protein [Nodularia spumigena]AHJ30414.1 hypothetical protein NSP_41140 [Nodularia spumigena CCY9414]AVZ31373.1 hypothetical protein BMF81_04056 [Nodularia spumigena UHCC 0039]EAW46973.1 hypothetical protein N9414_14875 [Nodularia spumigena CCY9414]MDB9383435.1 hypothetical protein [Nodularia spumigena CS-584]MEA5524354.1 hypothetical protein [Nodularia spumigena UHCC 0143]